MRLAQGQHLAMTVASITPTRKYSATGCSGLLAQIALVDVVAMQVVDFTKIVVDVHRALINVYRCCRRAGEGIKDATAAGDRIRMRGQIHQGNRKRISCGLDGCALCFREHVAGKSQTLALTQPFITSEEEGLPLHEGSSQIAAKLVAFERRNRPRRHGVESVARIKPIVTQEFIRLAVELVS